MCHISLVNHHTVYRNIVVFCLVYFEVAAGGVVHLGVILTYMYPCTLMHNWYLPSFSYSGLCISVRKLLVSMAYVGAWVTDGHCNEHFPSYQTLLN